LRLTGAGIVAKVSPDTFVYLHKGAKCKGGVQKIALIPKTAAEWCEFYGVDVKRGIATLYKAVDADFSTDRARSKNISYAPGETPEAPDWDGGKNECGNGLHFSPFPGAALKFNNGAHFVACPVKLSEIVVHPDGDYPEKVKAPRVYKPCYEVNIRGERIQPVDPAASPEAQWNAHNG
jgi:hypothetical protein